MRFVTEVVSYLPPVSPEWCGRFSREAKSACLWDIRTGQVLRKFNEYSPGVPINRDLFTHGFDPTGRFYALGGVRFFVIYSLKAWGSLNFEYGYLLINLVDWEGIVDLAVCGLLCRGHRLAKGSPRTPACDREGERVGGCH